MPAKVHERQVTEVPSRQTSNGLPQGWLLVPLRQVVTPSKEKIEPQDVSDSPYIGLEHIEAHTTRVNGHGHARDVRSTKVVFKQGDVLYGKLRPYLAKVCVAPFAGVASTDVLVFPRSAHLSSHYIAWFLSQPRTADFASHRSTGTQLPRVSFHALGELPFPLPPLAEQQRLVDLLERLLGELSSARDQLERVPETLERFRSAVLAAAVSGRLTGEWRDKNGPPQTQSADLLRALRGARYDAWSALEGRRKKLRGYQATNQQELRARYPEPKDAKPAFETPEGWEWASLDELTLVAGGVTKGQTRHPGVRVREVPYLRVANVQRGHLDLTEIKQIKATEAEIEELRLQPGDVLLNEGGDIDKLGRGWIWSGEIKECIHQNHVFRARPASELIEPKFISHYANTFGQRFFFDAGAQTVNLASISMTKVKSLPVPVPPIEEQREILRRIDALLRVADVIERRVAAANICACKLTRSILAKAFRGELVPTEAELAAREGRRYETAEELLERIRELRSEARQAVPLRRGRARRGRTA